LPQGMGFIKLFLLDILHICRRRGSKASHFNKNK